MKKDLSKQELYESVKMLVDLDESHPHIHLNQHKLFNLYSIAFQYLLYRSTKNPGAYIIRIEDSHFAEKISKRAKDPSSRKFLQTLLLPRKIKYNNSLLFLDFFNIASWNLTNEIPQNKIKGALIIKNSSTKPMATDHLIALDQQVKGGDEIKTYESDLFINDLPADYFYTSLQSFVSKTIIISHGQDFNNTHKLTFPFIKKDKDKTLSGVTLSNELDWDELE